MTSNEGMEDTISSFLRKIDKLETTINKLNSENQALINQVHDADNSYGANTEENQLLKAEIENLRDIVKKTDSERDKLRKRVTELCKLARLDSENKEKEIVKMKEKNAALECIVQKSDNEIREFSSKIPILVQEKNDLRDEIDCLQSEKLVHERDVTGIQEQLHRTELKLTLKGEEYDSLKIEFEELQTLNNADKRIQTIDTLDKFNNTLKVEIQSQRQSVVSAEKRFSEMQEQVTVLRDDLEDQMEELEKAMLDVVKYKEQYNRLAEENETLMKENLELRMQIRSMLDDKVKLVIVKDQKKRLMEDKLTQQNKIDDLTEQLGTMEETARSLLLITEEKQRHNDEFLNEINRLNLENANLQKEVVFINNKKALRFGNLQNELPSKSVSVKLGENEVHVSIKRLQEENRRLRTTLVMTSISEQNGITQVTTLQEELMEREEHLEKLMAHQKRLEEWINEVFGNKHQLVLQDGCNRLKDKMLGGDGLPDILQNRPLVSPHRSSEYRMTSSGSSPRPATHTFSMLGRTGGRVKKPMARSVNPPQTGYSPVRGRHTGRYSKMK